jgi:hypothetical protein
MKLVEIRCREGVINVWENRTFVAGYTFEIGDLNTDIVDYAREGEIEYDYGDDSLYEGVC